ncbi:MAG: lytic transglycosylase domain-containing protein [Burkholderiales bacterium]|nr:lytic transglycosylase domain-containing protein [Burkholderiales bacterium]
MEPSLFLALMLRCAPGVHPDTAVALVQVESGFNPWAIGVIGGELMHQPRSRAEALSTARSLLAQGWDFSVGLSQINARNFGRLGLTLETAFEPCANLAAMQSVLTECMDRAKASHPDAGQLSLRQALSCYYSGSFTTGFQHGYVQRVASAARDAKRHVPPNRSKEKT